MDLEQQVASATPGKLIVMLYQRAALDLKGAIELFSVQGDPRAQADAIHLIVHAQQIVGELQRCLNIREGGDLAANLAHIYDYMQYRLTEAIAKRETKPVVEIMGMLHELQEAWSSVTGLPERGPSSKTR